MSLPSLNRLVRTLIELRARGRAQVTLLAVCPNSEAVLEAAVQAAAQNHMPMLFAATLNQVDRDGGYTGWTPADFVAHLRRFGAHYGIDSLYPCLDHGGPWLKDAHSRAGLSLAETMTEVKASLEACLRAGYALLHIDPTVDRTLPGDAPIPIALVIERTLELIAFAEDRRTALGLPPVAYEVGTEEVHGGLVNLESFTAFLAGLHEGLAARNLLHAWPCFIVGKVGTDLHTTDFDPSVARRLFDLVAPYGSLVKGHYTDWVANPEAYPAAGMGGANVGPEFTAVEYQALADLVAKERALCAACPRVQPSRLLEALEDAVFRSNRWQKWLQPDERAVPFADLAPDRRAWLVQTGARYIWTDAQVQAARQQLYANLAPLLPNPHQYVVARIARAIDHYINAFGLFAANQLFGIEQIC
ncbi:MAG TPA: class II D-tagatose-bisphosphate aldolase, non-catalytic subunit [Caldilineaceae bacterium]|nr:class II D-tagatose-bisphosphate aldolase, non-catalytic subunit [Caldilineaceae bacterium]